MKKKVIGVGFQKTGTSTLREALKIMDYKVKDACPRALIPILKKDNKKILQIIEGFDALEDTPWYYIYKELDVLLPGSKFILTIRDQESWYISVARHIGNLRAAHHEWLYGRGKGLPKDDKENTISVYSSHNQEVIEYFKNRPTDLLVLDFTKGDKWERLCAFLGEDIPTADFPHANNNSKAKPQPHPIKRKITYARKQFKRWLKIKYIDLMGYW